MKRNVNKFDSLFTRLLAGCLSASEIKNFVVRKYDGLKIKPKEAENELGELNDLKNNLAYLGWIEQNKVVWVGKSIHKEDIKLNIVQWSKNLKSGRIINQGIIAKGAGENLDWLNENNEDLKGFTSSAIESLLKFVEVKRKKVLKAFSQELSVDEKIQEGLRISILFCRVSRRHGDLRLLNTAFKLNDWYYPFFKLAHSRNLIITFLLALTEQEITAAEMLQ
jgi:hypothetical protein